MPALAAMETRRFANCDTCGPTSEALTRAVAESPRAN
jgi:hypothetical protein